MKENLEKQFRNAIAAQCGFKNDPNRNFGMYEADRVAKAKAQPKLPSILQSEEDKRREERNADLRYESLMSDEQEYGPVCNERDDEGWRQ